MIIKCISTLLQSIANCTDGESLLSSIPLSAILAQQWVVEISHVEQNDCYAAELLTVSSMHLFGYCVYHVIIRAHWPPLIFTMLIMF